jgi:hypothetical protein
MPSTTDAQRDDKALEPAIRNIFGYCGQSTQLVSDGLPPLRKFTAQQGLAQGNFPSTARALAQLRGTCGAVLQQTLGAPAEKVHRTSEGVVVD